MTVNHEAAGSTPAPAAKSLIELALKQKHDMQRATLAMSAAVAQALALDRGWLYPMIEAHRSGKQYMLTRQLHWKRPNG